jgi:hypothetical protein
MKTGYVLSQGIVPKLPKRGPMNQAKIWLNRSWARANSAVYFRSCS